MKASLCLFLVLSLFTFAGPVTMAAELGTPGGQKLIEAAKKEAKVVVWSHSWQEGFLKGFLTSFNQKFPFLKVEGWDARAEEVVNRIITEAAAGRYTPDVLILPERGLPLLRNVGALREYDWPQHVERWNNQPGHKYWVNHAGEMHGPAYNPKIIALPDAPKSWEDLKDSRWRGKTVMSYSGSELPLLFAYLWRDKGKLNWDKTFSYWTEVIKAVRPRVVRGFDLPNQLLAAGETPLFANAAYTNAFRHIGRGTPLHFANVGKLPGKSWSIAVPKTIPRPNAAKLFIDYLVSPEGLIEYADGYLTPVLDPSIATRTKPNRILQDAGIDFELTPADVITEENVQKATEWWLTVLGVRR